MKRRLSRIVCVLVMLYVMGMTVCAAGAGKIENAEEKSNEIKSIEIKKDMVLQTNDNAELHSKPDSASATEDILQSGTPVIVDEAEKDGWCHVVFQEKSGYIQTSFLVSLGNEDVLASEFRNVEEENRLAYQEAEAAKQHIVSTRIWGSIIIVLVAAIFGVGIASALKKDKRV